MTCSICRSPSTADLCGSCAAKVEHVPDADTVEGQRAGQRAYEAVERRAERASQHYFERALKRGGRT